MRPLTYLMGFLAVTAVFSCKKDDTADIQGNPDTKFFTSNVNTGNRPVNSVNYSAVNIPDAAASGWTTLSTTLPATIRIPVFATKPVNRDVSISAEQDNSLVALYNAAKNTSYVALPAGILNTQGLSATIREGNTISADSISMAVNTANVKALTAPAYMAPIKLTTVSDPAAGRVTGDTSTSIAYVVLNVELRQIKYLAPVTDLTGTLLNKTGWAVSFNPLPATTGNVLDGSTTTFAKWNTPLTGAVQVDLDMQSSKNITGFRLYSSTTSTLAPTQTDVSVSDNGIEFKTVGPAARANVTYSAGYTYVVFYKPVTTRYIRLNVAYSTSTSSSNGRIAELDVYAN